MCGARQYPGRANGDRAICSVWGASKSRTWPENHYHSRLRLAGYREALTAAGLEVDPALIIGGEGRGAEAGHGHMKDFLSKNPAPTGFFCFNDKVAFGALKALQECGLSLPGDCSIVGVR